MAQPTSSTGGTGSGPAQEEEEPLNIEQMRFQVVDKDTGQVFRIDEMEQHINLNAYTLFPSRDELAQRLATGSSQADSDDETASPRGKEGRKEVWQESHGLGLCLCLCV